MDRVRSCTCNERSRRKPGMVRADSEECREVLPECNRVIDQSRGSGCGCRAGDARVHEGRGSVELEWIGLGGRRGRSAVITRIGGTNRV